MNSPHEKAETRFIMNLTLPTNLFLMLMLYLSASELDINTAHVTGITLVTIAIPVLCSILLNHGYDWSSDMLVIHATVSLLATLTVLVFIAPFIFNILPWQQLLQWFFVSYSFVWTLITSGVLIVLKLSRPTKPTRIIRQY